MKATFLFGHLEVVLESTQRGSESGCGGSSGALCLAGARKQHMEIRAAMEKAGVVDNGLHREGRPCGIR